VPALSLQVVPEHATRWFSERLEYFAITMRPMFD